MAVEDAVVLAQCLKAVPTPRQSHKQPASTSVEAALASFVARRFPRTRSIVEASRRLGKIGQCQRRAVCGLRDWLVATAMPLMRARGLPRFAAFDVGAID